MTMIDQYHPEPQPGDYLPPYPADLSVWIGARVDYIHIHGIWPDIQTGTVLEAKYDHRGYRKLLIRPDDPTRLTMWRTCPHDIMIVE